MPSLTLSNVSFSYTSAHDVLSGVDLDLGTGWHGLVGANGAGKSTLLALVAGEHSPTAGTIDIPGPVAMCQQVVDTPDAGVVGFAESHESGAYVLRGRLDIEPEDLGRWPTLSPGERRRWQVGAALFAEPTVLLLDEPTNHLDRATTALLASMLARFRGVGVLVSHDRDLLDQLTTSTIRVVDGAVEHWHAPYTAARTEWEEALRRRVEERRAATAETRKLERRLDDQRRAAEKKRAAWSRSQRYARPGDHDTTSTARTDRHRKGEAAAGSRISALREATDRADERRRSIDVGRDHRGSISFEGEPAPRPILVSHDGPLVAGETVLAAHLTLDIARDSSVHISGPNGVGKTTLLQALAGDWDLDPEQLLFLPQDLSLEESARFLGSVTGRGADDLGATLQLFARLGGEPDVVLTSELPSPGELRKLILADALRRNVWCMLLDEPTNHLDLDTVEALEDALLGFPGALVVVSHDDRFARTVTTTSVELERSP